MFWSALTYEPIVRIGIGPLGVSPHGIFTAVGFLVGAWFFLRETRSRGIDDEPMGLPRGGVTSDLWCREVLQGEDVHHAQAVSEGVPG